MIPDFTTLPATGGLVFAGLLYGGLSLFLAGPFVGERSIEKLGWEKDCPAILVRPDEPGGGPGDAVASGPSCGSLAAPFLGDTGRVWCQAFGTQIDGALSLLTAERRAARQRELAQAAAEAPSRCRCAVTTTLERHRVPLAVYAGSLRLVAPPPVSRLREELTAAARSPLCAGKA